MQNFFGVKLKAPTQGRASAHWGGTARLGPRLSPLRRKTSFEGDGAEPAGGLLPAAAEGRVELDEGEGFVLLRGDEIELRGEEVGVGGEDLEVAGGSALVTDAGEARGVLCGGDELLLLFASVAGFLGGDERVGDVAEGAEDGLLIVEDQLFFLRLGELELAAELCRL